MIFSSLSGWGQLAHLSPGFPIHIQNYRLWLDGLNPVLVDQIHVFSSYFYKKLCSKKWCVTTISLIPVHSLLPSSADGYAQVRKWTQSDIFGKKFLIVPINEDYHWYLASIYEPEHVLKPPSYEVQDRSKMLDRSSKYNLCNFYRDRTNW